MVEQLIRNQQVGSSNLLAGSIGFKGLGSRRVRSIEIAAGLACDLFPRLGVRSLNPHSCGTSDLRELGSSGEMETKGCASLLV